MAIKDLAEIVKKFTQKDKFKPSAFLFRAEIILPS